METSNAILKMYHLKNIVTLFALVFHGVQLNAQQSELLQVRPNIVWIVAEDMSLHLSSFGDKQLQTPNLDALATDGVKYTNTYTVAGVCAPSRNGIITGMYPTSIGGDNMRNYQPGTKSSEGEASDGMASYSIVPPPFVKCYAQYLREAGYYCTNNPKEDYQFEAPVTAWDESSGRATWKNAPEGKPFFAIFNLAVSHESQIWKRDSIPLLVNPATVLVPPYYPDVPEVRHDIARNLSNIIEMDRQAGKIISDLKDAGLYENTLIFFYTDHGDGLPYVKREITVRGLHIPMIIKYPGNLHAGETDAQLISAIDFAPSLLSVANIPIPAYMQGQAFIGAQKKTKRQCIFAARDRMDEKVDRVRSIYDGRFQLLKNYMPSQPYYQDIAFRLQMPMMRRIIAMRDSGKLNATQMRWFKPKNTTYELYDLQKDPYQLNNIIDVPAYKDQFQKLKIAMDSVLANYGDVHSLPEKDLVKKMRNGSDTVMATGKPLLVSYKNGYMISCPTEGANIAYKIKKAESRDFPKAWSVYMYQFLDMHRGDEIMIQAQRIGFTPANLNLIIE